MMFELAPNDASLDIAMLAIAALMPITAGMLIGQTNPYHALVVRGILGAVAALVYALFGAADVALTEALVGTMLSITLYAVAVRSSLSMRLGVLEPYPATTAADSATESDLATANVPDSNEQPNCEHFEQVLAGLRQPLSQYHMRLEVVAYPTIQALQAALAEKDVHAICWGHRTEAASHDSGMSGLEPYLLQTRIARLYSLFQIDELLSIAQLEYVEAAIAPTHSSHPSPSSGLTNMTSG
ncbi:DUF4040 domain-containing protein [Leptolyngbya sp. AN02str]|uniref:DUF4040 domain-containing protein n=1 Tax=Leptolyngbya sp. AN02str TaxID=3423363 RepID=UPI003D31409F